MKTQKTLRDLTKDCIIRCELCNEILEPKRVKWLELSETDGNYYSPSKFPKGHKSQGCFSFGVTCATNLLRETLKNIIK
jgi:hypothetical protein